MKYKYKEYIEELIRTPDNRATESDTVIYELAEVYKKAEKYNELVMLEKDKNDEYEDPIKELAITMITNHLNGWIEQVYKDEGIMIHLPPNKKYAGINQPTNEVVMYISEKYAENPMTITPKQAIEEYMKPKLVNILKLIQPTNEVCLHVGTKISEDQDRYTHIGIKFLIEYIKQ